MKTELFSIECDSSLSNQSSRIEFYSDRVLSLLTSLGYLSLKWIGYERDSEVRGFKSRKFQYRLILSLAQICISTHVFYHFPAFITKSKARQTTSFDIFSADWYKNWCIFSHSFIYMENNHYGLKNVFFWRNVKSRFHQIFYFHNAFIFL